MKLKNSNCDYTKKKLWQNFKFQIVTKLKKINLRQNYKKLNCDETQKLKLGQNSKTQIVTKLKYSNCDKTQKLKSWQNSKTQIVTKLENSN